MDKYLYIVDGSNYLYRAFFALPYLSTTKGLPTNSVYGFTRMITKLLKEKSPKYMAVVFDKGKSKERMEIYREYKATRPPMPADLQVQIPYVLRILKALGIPIIMIDNVEADDIIGTLAKRAKEKDFTVVIVSPDKDLLQLVENKILVFDPMKEVLYDEKKVTEKYGVPPSRLAVYFSLIGDKSDNIPGVKGIGDKSAKELALKFESLDEIYKRISSLPLSLRKKLVEGKNDAYLSESLFKINRDIDLSVDIEDLRVRKPNLEELKYIYRELEFNSLLKEIEKHNPLTYSSNDNSTNDDSNGYRDLKTALDINIYREKETLVFVIPEVDGFAIIGESSSIRINDPDGLKGYVYSASEVLAYDAKRLISKFLVRGIRPGFVVYDLAIAIHLINPLRKFDSLRDILISHIGSGEINYSNLSRLWKYIKTKLEEKGLSKVYYDIELPLTEVLADMEIRGVKVDRERLLEIRRDIDSRIRSITQEIYETAGMKFNINSPRQLAFVLFEKLGLPPIKKTKTGYSTDIEVLETLSEYHRLPALLIEYRQLSKLKSTYVDGLLSVINPETGRVHTTYNQTAVVTGRLSSSEPNLQNIPIKGDYGKLLRGVFIPEKGYKMVSFDYSQIELRVLAELSKDEILLDAFRKGEDIHTSTAISVFQVAKEEVTSELRRKAKVVNFGIIYGMSPYGLSKELGISVEEAKRFIDLYFERYRGVREFIESTISEAKKKGFVRTYFGRIRPIPEFYSPRKDERELAKRIAINTPIQGTSAEIIKIAMRKVYDFIRERDFDAHMVLQIHDELVFEVREKLVDSFVEEVKEIMENVVPEFEVPLVVDVHVGDSWDKEG